MRAKPLAGITVLDLTRLLPGPLCTQHLGDLGADVIKIEDTKAGDYTRWREPVRKQNSAFFLSVNRNKRSLKLDLQTDAGREVFYRLAREADIIVEQFRPGVMERLKIDASCSAPFPATARRAPIATAPGTTSITAPMPA